MTTINKAFSQVASYERYTRDKLLAFIEECKPRVFRFAPPTFTKPPATYPPLYVYNNGTSNHVNITAGSLHFPSINYTKDFAEVNNHSCSSGDFIFIQRSGDNDWEIGYGDEPTDCLFIRLGKITGLVVDYTKGWNGGDITFPEMFPVQAKSDGVDPPGYTYKTMNGVEIGSGATPNNVRLTNVAYICDTTDFDDTFNGIAGFNKDGSFKFFVLNEYPKVETECLACITGGPDSNGCYTIVPKQCTVLKKLVPDVCPS